MRQQPVYRRLQIYSTVFCIYCESLRQKESVCVQIVKLCTVPSKRDELKNHSKIENNNKRFTSRTVYVFLK